MSFLIKFSGLVLFAFSLTNQLYSETVIGANNGNKPWMLFITQIIPPRGPVLAQQFSRSCFEKMTQLFDTTSYQIILLQPGQDLDNISNRKKDLILSSDNADFWTKGAAIDTLIVWLRFKVGFHHSRIAVPYTRGQSGALPELVAQHVFFSATSEFLSTLSLQTGPEGVAVTIAEDIIAYPPCTFLIPPGNYIINSTLPQFQKRSDTLEIIPGKQYSRRILLLPLE